MKTLKSIIKKAELPEPGLLTIYFLGACMLLLQLKTLFMR